MQTALVTEGVPPKDGLVSGGVAVLIWGLVQAPQDGWTSSRTLVALALGALLILAQPRRHHEGGRQEVQLLNRLPHQQGHHLGEGRDG
jgi:hypothetical protein